MVAEPKRYRELQQPDDPAAGEDGSGTAENVRHTGGPPTSRSHAQVLALVTLVGFSGSGIRRAPAGVVVRAVLSKAALE